MKGRTFPVYAVIASALTLNLAAASWISLHNSDSSPWERTFPGQCAYPSVSVIYDNPGAKNPKVIEVDLTGDFSNCIGSQVLVTTYKTGHIHSYAVADIIDNQGIIQLSFIKHGGDFYQKFPLVINSRLVSSGPVSPSSNSIDPNDIQVTFAWTWS